MIYRSRTGSTTPIRIAAAVAIVVAAFFEFIWK